MKIYTNIFEKIISLENLFLAWDNFRADKQYKKDVREFEWKLEQNIFQLYRDLKYKKYQHGPYTSFYLHDPKQRLIHKATVKDRVLHHAIFAILNPVFEPTFISHSFSCRVDKGTHKGVDTLERILRKVSRNNYIPCFALKCDIKKFFASIDHDILLNILRRRIKDRDTMWLLKEIVESFVSNQSLFSRKGLPIGNLTSQLFANIYMNEFDQFIKRTLKVKHYVRYTDDFVVVADSEAYLRSLVNPICSFLQDKLVLELHQSKIIIRKFHQGIDFLGYIIFPHYRLVRTKTKQRIYRKLKQRVEGYKNGMIGRNTLEQSLHSYLGVLSHANTYKLGQKLENQFWFWLNE